MPKRIFGFVILLLVYSFSPLAKYHPHIKWREISTPGEKKFTVIFPQGYLEEAKYTVNSSLETYDKLKLLWKAEIKGKIRILLTDVYDYSNGSATFFPFNHIEIYLYYPPPDSPVGNYKNWIDLVLSHELTHLFNLNMGSGLTYFLRRIFGAHPLCYPMIYASVWIHEGLATYAESQLYLDGRLNTPDYKIMLSQINKNKGIPSISHIYGEPTDWPGPIGRYLYGGAFMHYLASTYGKETISQFVKHYSKYPIPLIMTNGLDAIELTVSRRFQKVFKKNLSTLWDEFKRSQRVITPPPSNKVKILTLDGIEKKYPILTDTGRVFYVSQNYQEYPGIYQLNTHNLKRKRQIKKANINSMSYDTLNKKIYFSANDWHKSYFKYSDIYVLNLDDMKVKQLTRGARLSYPMVIGKRIYCVKRIKSTSFLAYLHFPEGKETIISKGFDSMAYLSPSPSGEHIAASIKLEQKNWSIGLFTTKGELLNIISQPEDKKNYFPVWINQNEVLYIKEHKDSYRLCCFNLKRGIYKIYTGPTLPSIKYFSCLPGYQDMVISFFDTNGHNLGQVNLAELEFETLNPTPASKIQNTQASPTSPSNQLNPRPYNFLRDLSPKYFTPSLRSAGNEIQTGLFLSGTDVLSKHTYSLSGYYGFTTKTFNWNVNYIFDGLYPTLILRYKNYSDLHQDANNWEYTYQQKKLEFLSFTPVVIRDKHQLWLYSNLYSEKINAYPGYNNSGESLKLKGLKAGILFNSSQRYYDSISQADGFRFTLSFSQDLKTLGSDYNISTGALEYKQYCSIFRPNVLAIRICATDSWGEARRRFYMGGAKHYDGDSLAGDNMFELMRGYPSGYFSGTGGYLINMEYRISMLKIERAFLLIRSIDRIHFSFFTDIGNLWTHKKELNPSFSLGAELTVAIIIGDFRYSLSGGIAVGQHPYHRPTLYFRIGNSF
jgi:hypothetical protein